MNPRVMLQRLDDEPDLPIAATEIFTPDPFHIDVDIKLEEDTEYIVKTEVQEFSFEPALMFENDEVPVKLEVKSSRRKSSIVSVKIPKSNKTEVKLNRIAYEKKILRGCKVPSCDFMIHPKLVKDHNSIFHPVKVKGQPKPKVHKKVPIGREMCPYCPKVLSTSSTKIHVRYFKPLKNTFTNYEAFSSTSITKRQMV
jgi:hypothetical protein